MGPQGLRGPCGFFMNSGVISSHHGKPRGDARHGCAEVGIAVSANNS